MEVSTPVRRAGHSKLWVVKAQWRMGLDRNYALALASRQLDLGLRSPIAIALPTEFCTSEAVWLGLIAFDPPGSTQAEVSRVSTNKIIKPCLLASYATSFGFTLALARALMTIRHGIVVCAQLSYQYTRLQAQGYRQLHLQVQERTPLLQRE